MERICRQKTGLFPSPDEIKLSCSCPDWASMCKHVAAVLYGIGARLDQQPELLFKLHQVDEKELIAKAGKALPLARKAPGAQKVLGGEDLSELFGLEMAQTADAAAPLPVRRRSPSAPNGKSTKKPKQRSAMVRERESRACPQGPHLRQFRQKQAMIDSHSTKMKTKAGWASGRNPNFGRLMKKFWTPARAHLPAAWIRCVGWRRDAFQSLRRCSGSLGNRRLPPAWSLGQHPLPFRLRALYTPKSLREIADPVSRGLRQPPLLAIAPIVFITPVQQR